MRLMPAAVKVRIETELAAVMPASHTRYSLPLAPVVDEPLSSDEVAALAAPSERFKSMDKETQVRRANTRINLELTEREAMVLIAALNRHRLLSDDTKAARATAGRLATKVGRQL